MDQNVFYDLLGPVYIHVWMADGIVAATIILILLLVLPKEDKDE